ncbi:MAG: MBL fold metallo-hydrolase [Burkholderiales bacterium]|nr:MBL fold metallo-hydrolase [Burkholderiales bacterium]
MASDAGFSVRFWGVRGSIACAGPQTARYGGNTAALEVRCGARLLVFDAGTGIRYLGNALEAARHARLEADLFLSHTHFDHICGLPFFKPFFSPQNRFRLWAGHLGGRMTLRQVLAEFMMSPLFPVPPEVFRAEIDYRDFAAGETLELGDGIRLRTAPLNHPDGATGYRVEYGGRALCYVTDTEHVPGAPDRNVLGLIAGADLVIYDCTYTDEEYAQGEVVGWGHSTWQEAVRLCRAAGARRLAIFHHEPDRSDEALDAIGAQAAAEFSGALVAREAMTIAL